MMGNQCQALQREKGRFIVRRMIVKTKKLMREENNSLRLLREFNRAN